MTKQIEYYRSKLAFEIDSWDLLEAQRSGRDIVVLDARSESHYAKCHIAGAISFPHRLITAEGTTHFKPDALYVVYCDGIGCNASTQGALKMATLGFTVRELIGGLDWWKKAGYPTHSTTNSARQAEVG